ncbi:pilus assembly PilX family protein [Dyella telluris]|uniref:Pilus assembly PilX N-terminal domain-containing protein n=1 Tax=Dyella telluris TaxID=2763498 RepID=A0A7G8Q0P2_9GAMM|nr:pilus assembly PilX N-terminal domain-containing protein [Dyella telluris]QNK00350.1 pilus assembly PilX N-terminal domain-containing protein [Dyella telluris]
MKRSTSARRGQRGFTLITTLIFLLIFMVSAVSMVGVSMVDVKVASNQQFQLEAHTAAQQGIEYVVSQPFTQTLITTTTSVPVPLYSSSATYTAQVLAPVCEAVTPAIIPSPPTTPQDQACAGSSGYSTSGLINSGPTTSATCSDTQWDVQSTVNDATFSATSVVLHQGISARMYTIPARAVCK